MTVTTLGACLTSCGKGVEGPSGSLTGEEEEETLICGEVVVV
jgi:hypothetical protein